MAQTSRARTGTGIFVLHQNRVEHGYGQKNAIKPWYLHADIIVV